MPQVTNLELLLYADDTCLSYRGKDTKTTKEQLSRDFNSLGEWLIDNKLSIHFGEEKYIKKKQNLFYLEQKGT